jgi:hypothetical protein
MMEERNLYRRMRRACVCENGVLDVGTLLDALLLTSRWEYSDPGQRICCLCFTRRGLPQFGKEDKS